MSKPYLVVTLLMKGDDYLPGALVLGYSLLRTGTNEEFDVGIMLTPDVSQEARLLLENSYSRIITVGYIEKKVKFAIV